MEDETESPIDDLEASEDLEDDENLGDASIRGVGAMVAPPGENVGAGRVSAC